MGTLRILTKSGIYDILIASKRLNKGPQELKEEIDNKTQPIVMAVLELSGKAAVFDHKVTILDGKVVALDGKVDRIHEELETEINETRHEVLASVKFP